MNAILGLGQPAVYQIRVQGCLDDRWAHWFEGMTLERDDVRRTTTLTGTVPDQAALHGLLARIRDLGLPLLSVRYVTSSGRAEVANPGHRANEKASP